MQSEKKPTAKQLIESTFFVSNGMVTAKLEDLVKVMEEYAKTKQTKVDK